MGDLCARPGERILTHQMRSAQFALVCLIAYWSLVATGLAAAGKPETVPGVVGSRESIALADLRARGLGAAILLVRSRYPAGTVTWESPAAGTRTTYGDAVRIHVSVGPK